MVWLFSYPIACQSEDRPNHPLNCTHGVGNHSDQIFLMLAIIGFSQVREFTDQFVDTGRYPAGYAHAMFALRSAGDRFQEGRAAARTRSYFS